MTTDTPVDTSINDTDTKKPDKSNSESFVDKLRNLKDTSTNVLEFLLGLIAIISGSVGYTIFLIVFPILPVIGLVIGFVHQKNCPVDERIPIWLIVWSFGNIFRQLFTLVVKQFSEECQKSNWLKPIYLLDIFVIIWFFVGNFWVYGIYKPDYGDVDSIKYCHETVYVYSFVVITLIYVLILIALVVVLISAILCACLFKKVSATLESALKDDEKEKSDAV